MTKNLFAQQQPGAFEKGDLAKPSFAAFATPAGRAMFESARDERLAREEEERKKEEALLEEARLKQEEEDRLKQEEEEKALLEAARLKEEEEARNKGVKTADELTESLHGLLLEAADQSERAQAAAAVLDWAQGGDPSAEAFDEMAIGLAGIDDTTEELSDAQIDEYNRWLNLLAEAAISLGADQDSVTTMIDDDDSDAAQSVMDSISGSGDDDEAIAAFSVTGGDDGAMMESAMLEASIKVVRGGKIKIVRKRPHKMRMSGAQKAALKKARLKAQTATAKVARAKSMKIRKKRGL